MSIKIDKRIEPENMNTNCYVIKVNWYSEDAEFDEMLYKISGIDYDKDEVLKLLIPMYASYPNDFTPDKLTEYAIKSIDDNSNLKYYNLIELYNRVVEKLGARKLANDDLLDYRVTDIDAVYYDAYGTKYQGEIDILPEKDKLDNFEKLFKLLENYDN